MRLQVVIARTAVFGLLLGPLLNTVEGQWLSYPTAGVPRARDGKPDLGAACPRATDGKPDLSGLWIMQTKRPGNADFPGCDPVADEFINIAGSLKGGLPYQPWAAELVKARRTQQRVNDPMSRCSPIDRQRRTSTAGMPRSRRAPHSRSRWRWCRSASTRDQHRAAIAGHRGCSARMRASCSIERLQPRSLFQPL